jgi:hypothetical protein
MIQPTSYRDLRGKEIPLHNLDDDERHLVVELKARAAKQPPCNAFDNYWVKTVGDFYTRRGLGRRETTKTAPWKVAQDLSGRLAIAQGQARPPDYRDELDDLIQEHFPTRRAFCEATGLSEDMLSHVLARRKHLAIDTLNDALSRIGYTLRIEPLEVVEKNA